MLLCEVNGREMRVIPVVRVRFEKAVLVHIPCLPVFLPFSSLSFLPSLYSMRRDGRRWTGDVNVMVAMLVSQVG